MPTLTLPGATNLTGATRSALQVRPNVFSFTALLGAMEGTGRPRHGCSRMEAAVSSGEGCYQRINAVGVTRSKVFSI